MNKTRTLITVLFTLAAGLLRATTATPDNIIPIRVGNLVYAGDQSSVCFSDRFLETVNQETNLTVDPAFHPVKLGEDRVFDHPFCVFSGEDVFQLTEQERRNLRQYLMGGGFILSSPSCSNADWDRSLRRELKLIFPEYKLKQIPMSDPLFSTVYDITRLVEKHGKTVMLEGLEINGRIVMIYSREGLNDVANADGCCCCGGNEIREPVKVNVNILTYALLY
ncbi:DUF4159 domain-containing protein [Ruficoccus amylovorans]|uniref:DUF4159 domain-containing protein n=1 Tax=Ruficoccus amylovorans TaxID=1804625 RepID=A0A842HC00_9BACT|nr:DUF4159 domain-containing protein [Ruficoccus amylovorans]MBC2593942.1 DUF4159 domain-containing protein [Ruficoccus amylovorans]